MVNSVSGGARVSRFVSRVRVLFPGLLVAILVALAAQFVAEHYGAPAMLMALLFGIALNFLSESEPTASGIAFTAKTVLRFGVAILGARISLELFLALGWDMIVLLIVGGVGGRLSSTGMTKLANMAAGGFFIATTNRGRLPRRT